MMSKILYTIAFSLISLFSIAQTNLITGKVVIDDAVAGQDALEGIIVENQKTHAKATTNAEGMFSIKASVGDELSFSNDFYEERSVKVSQEMLKKGFIIVHLNIEVVELAETTVNTLDKNWKNNVKDSKTKETALYEGLGLDPNMQYKKVNPNASSVLNGNGPLDPTQWISMISGQKKKAKKQDQYFKRVEKIKAVEDYFTTEYFVESLNIPENKVNDFVTYCYSNFEIEKLVKQNKYERIEEVFKEQASTYLNMIEKK
ncbi:hypothetical protein SAMN05443634_10736 [Chishuiella changwenlii]|jgi:hypothetical protein|uniref:CarboxypepD_reg-like domain-containing protein n=2 Tax=Chishuiella changwenlii TaxID=1434701 RepID=A0A1M6YU51_9FLAO|nr:hypothetical protein [Chishuiella changwenlii]GGE88229.1 hypothetical protein GCM10010984_02460 [Chishuiella changwenlii]SHL21615.1 hypothetical protein SAMN05443634_10736 [Chishuiella changwenlii]